MNFYRVVVGNRAFFWGELVKLKKLLLVLAATLVFGMTSTGFAEENPSVENSEVPAKISDAVKLSGKIEYTSTHATVAADGIKAKGTTNSYVFQLDTLAKINAHWTANARIELEGNFGSGDFDSDETLDVDLPRVWLEGDYGNFNIRLGKMELLTNEGGLIWDTDFTGAHMTFGNVLKFSMMGGQISSENLDDGVLDESVIKNDHVNFVGVNLQYENYSKLFGGAGYYRVMGDEIKNTNDLNCLWSANMGYIFSDKFVISGSFAQNVMAVYEKNSWQATAVYGNYDDYPERGDWNVLLCYRQYGTSVSFAPTREDVLEGSRGWVVGATYAPLKNVGVEVKYFKGKDLNDGSNVKSIWGRVEFFF